MPKMVKPAAVRRSRCLLCREKLAGAQGIAGGTWVAHVTCWAKLEARAAAHPILGRLPLEERRRRLGIWATRHAMQQHRAAGTLTTLGDQ